MTASGTVGTRPRPTRVEDRLLAALRRPPTPGVLGLLPVLLVAATDFKFRTRSAAAAQAGSVDLQVGVEILVWAAVGGYLAWHLLQRASNRLVRRRRLPTSMRMLVAFVTVLAVSSLRATSVLALVRGAQYVVLLAWAMLVLLDLDADALRDAWRWFRRGLVALALAGIAGSVAMRSGFYVDANDVDRYRWFAMHPIATANVISPAVLAVLGTMFGTQDPWFARKGVRPLLAVVLGGALVATRSRGAIAGTLVAGLFLLLASRSARGRAVAAMGALAGTAMLLLGVGAGALRDLAFRGQSTQTLGAFNGRAGILRVALERVEESPLLGFGYLAGRSLFLDQFSWSPGESHNVFIEVLVSTGYPGLVIVTLLLGVAGVGALRVWRRRDGDRDLGPEMLALLALLGVSGLVTEGFIAVSVEAVALVWVLVATGVYESRWARGSMVGVRR